MTNEAIVNEATYNTQLGLLFGGQVCDMMRFDDKTVVSNTQKGLQQLMDDLNHQECPSNIRPAGHNSARQAFLYGP